MSKILFILLILTFIRIHQCEKYSYDGYKVYRIKNYSDVLSNKNVDILNKFKSDTENYMDVLVSPKFQDKIAQENFEILIDDVQSLISNELVHPYGDVLNWTSYHTLETIYDWMDSLAVEYPESVTVISAGVSFEDRDIKGVKISSGTGNKAVFIEGGIHAREWISPATVTYIINEILTSDDIAFRRIAESFDWYIFPVVNPDGFVYSHVKTRYWRKTRTPYERCTGADGNRNWDFHWGEAGTSDFVCDDNYGGPGPFSEVEIQSLADFMLSIKSDLQVFLSFHSYSQTLLFPYANTTEHLENYDDMMKIGRKAAEALAVRYNTTYRVGNAAEIQKNATGVSMDWVKENIRVPMSFTYELRDTGKFGFLLPATEIIPNCEEIIDSLIAMFEEAQNLGYVILKDVF